MNYDEYLSLRRDIMNAGMQRYDGYDARLNLLCQVVGRMLDAAHPAFASRQASVVTAFAPPAPSSGDAVRDVRVNGEVVWASPKRDNDAKIASDNILREDYGLSTVPEADRLPAGLAPVPKPPMMLEPFVAPASSSAFREPPPKANVWPDSEPLFTLAKGITFIVSLTLEKPITSTGEVYQLVDKAMDRIHRMQGVASVDHSMPKTIIEQPKE